MSDETKLWVSSRLTDPDLRPEEKVRKALLHKMEEELGYPKGLLLVEKELKMLPHIKQVVNIPSRRFDIVCLAKDLHPDHVFYPLLLIECKAHSINLDVMRQVVGYNRFVKSIFVALASPKEFYLGRYDGEKGEYIFSPRLPTFENLYEEALCITKT